jgi:hypothetical protein
VSSEPPPITRLEKRGDLGEVIDAIRAGFAYANVHTNPFLGGEIRGQLRINDDDK